MTRTYALKRLLEHGPLTRSEMLEITGWPYRVLERALLKLCETDIARSRGRYKMIYELK